MKEAYVKIETAQLLKEKGFDWGCNGHWYIGESKTFEISSSTDPINWNEVKTDLDWLSCPTQQMACRWLREEKGFYVYATYGCYPILNEEYWIPEIGSMMDFDVPDDFYKEYNSPEDAIEAALQYCLTKLIEQ